MRHHTDPKPFGRLAAALLALGAFAGSAAAQGGAADTSLLDVRRAQVRAVYGAEHWPAGAARPGIRLASLELEGWEGLELRARAGLLKRNFRAPRAARPSFVVEAVVGPSSAQAHGRLVDWLAGVSSTTVAPTTAERGRAVGDAGFVGLSGAGPRAESWVAFARGNVAVRVSAFDPRARPELDVLALAAAIDASILTQPALEPGAPLPVPTIATLAGAKAVQGPTPVPLEVAVVDPAGGEPHLRWIVGGTGQGYVERDAAGVWTFHPTGPGAVELTLEATGSTGTFATRAIHIDVADD